jgi:hypothetical protein
MEKSEHQLFLTRQDVIDHKAWLVGMKERFVTMRKALKPISVDYRKDGRWISAPEQCVGTNCVKDDGP